jgi:hypothetical protein
VLQWNPQGNRGRGRPRHSWRRSTLREAARSWSELRYLVVDQDKQRKGETRKQLEEIHSERSWKKLE